MAKNLALPLFQFITNPSAPAITNQGAAGGTAYGYGIVAKVVYVDGTIQYTAVSATGSTATGNAALTGANFNRATWAAVTAPVGGSVSYDVYRLSGGASQGKIGNTSSTTFDDTGLVGDATTAPATNKTGIGSGVDILSLSYVTGQLSGAGSAFVATVDFEISNDGVEWKAAFTCSNASTLGSLATSVYNFIRAHMTAYTSGIATMKAYAAGK